MGLKSLYSHLKLLVEFKNESDHEIDLFWINFNGKAAEYKKLLSPGDTETVQTFISHPWIARNSVTGRPMILNGQNHFIAKLPKSLHGQGIGEMGVEAKFSNVRDPSVLAKLQASVDKMMPIVHVLIDSEGISCTSTLDLYIKKNLLYRLRLKVVDFTYNLYL